MRYRAGKKVMQIDIETNEEIAVYGSIQEAAYDNYISEQQLRNAIKNNGGAVYGRPLKFRLLE